MVEKKDYINRAFEIKQTLETGTDEKDFIEYFIFSNSGVDIEMEESILEIVSQQLKQYKIVDWPVLRTTLSGVDEKPAQQKALEMKVSGLFVLLLVDRRVFDLLGAK